MLGCLGGAQFYPACGGQLLAGQLQVEGVEFGVPGALHIYGAEGLAVDDAAVYDEGCIEVGRLLQTVHLEMSADTTVDIKGRVLQQHFA